MMAALSVFGTNQAYDDFLYAPVCGEVDEMPLSVLTALTRLNLDPWKEASELSSLPQETAIRRLAALIARLPAMQSGKLDSAQSARRLVALLPSPTRSIPLPGGKMIGGINLPGAPSRSAIVLLAVLLLSTVVLVFAMAQEQASQTAPAQTPPSSRSTPQTL